MIDRRKFLGRSVLSAGSVIFSSALLQSCTKYGTPLPGHGSGSGPDKPPLIRLGESGIDWNDGAKAAVITGLAVEQLVGGEVLGPLVDVFWPGTNDDVWTAVKEEMEGLINQKLDTDTWSGLSGLQKVLEDLNDASARYRFDLQNSFPDKVLIQWRKTESAFSVALPGFTQDPYQVLLLPFYVQCVNMYLSVLRDAVMWGYTNWGMTEAERWDWVAEMKKDINDFTRYTQKTYDAGLTNVQNNTKRDDKLVEPFNSVNKYVRQMTLMVLDFMNAWPYFDATISEYYPNATVKLTREIYSDPIGTVFGSSVGPVNLPTTPPSQFPTFVQVVNDRYLRLQGLGVLYPPGGGPDGVTLTKLMGYADSNSIIYLYEIPKGKKIAAVYTTYGPGEFVKKDNTRDTTEFPHTLQFVYNDQTNSPVFGANEGSSPVTWSFKWEALSSIYINGVYYGTLNLYSDSQVPVANCIVYGFMYWQSPEETLKAIRSIYVTSPKERSAADFAKAFPKIAIPASLITEELKAARKAHWASIKAQAGG